jgi:hypothetical protein
MFMKEQDLRAVLEISGTTPRIKAEQWLAGLPDDDPVWLELAMTAHLGSKRMFRLKQAGIGFAVGFVPTVVAFLLSLIGG